MTAITRTDWRGLYRAAFWAAILMLALIPVQIAFFLIWPPPSTVEGFYQLLMENPLLGLLSLDLLYLVNNALLVILYLAFAVSLFPRHPSAVSIALAFGMIGIAAYYTSVPAFELLDLSRQYAAAAQDAEQLQVLAAGKALLAGYTGTAFDAYYVFNAIALLLISWAILKSALYSKMTGWFGLAAGVFMLIPSSAGEIGLAFSLLSLIPWTIFTLLAALRFRTLPDNKKAAG